MISKLLKIIDVTNSRIKVLRLFIMFLTLGLLGLFLSIQIGEVTELLLQNNSNGIKVSLFLFALISLLLVIISYASKVYSAQLRTSIIIRLKEVTVRHLFDANSTDRSKFKQGDLIARFNTDISSMASATILTSTLIKSIVILAVYIIAIGLFDIRLLLLFLIPFPIVLVMQTYTARKSEGYITPWKESMSSTFNLSQDIINNQINIRSYESKNVVSQWINKALNNNFSTSTRGIFKLYILQIPTVVIAFSSLVLIGAIGLKWVQEGSLSVSKLISTISLVTVANDEFNNILNMVNNIPHLIVSANRIFPIWDLEPESFGHETIGDPNKPLIEFDNVSFKYEDSQENVLSNISFKVFDGDRIGIIGKSGSGKSTIMKLILGQYKPSSGKVYFKGVSIQDWDKQMLRSKLTSVTQDPYLLSDSIRDNLLLIDNTKNDQDFLNVLGLVKLDSSFENNTLLDIQCGEGGKNLSGGQRQRLSMARSLLKIGDVALFDEATSALDNLSEKAIQDLLADETILPTQLLIAHRINTLNHCNKIIVLDNGHIIEYGSPHKLIEKKGAYFEALKNSQGVLS